MKNFLLAVLIYRAIVNSVFWKTLREKILKDLEKWAESTKATKPTDDNSQYHLEEFADGTVIPCKCYRRQNHGSFRGPTKEYLEAREQMHREHAEEDRG